jgi:branched-chain amino acid transport system substrate-binding protein
MTNPRPLGWRLGVLAMLLATLAGSGLAQKRYDTGASDTEIKIGHSIPYSGPVSAYGTMGKAGAAYFAKVNAEGGIHGRKINFISLDDAYNPTKAVEAARKLVEQDGVLLMYAPVGTAQNIAIRRYMNAKKVPHLFVGTGATLFGDPAQYPWTMGWLPSYQTEGRIFAQHVLATQPEAKVAVLYQNDDFGRDYLKGFRDALGAKADTMVVAQQSYEVTDPTVDSQIVTLKGSGATVLVNLSTPKFGAQAIRRVAALGWKPTHYVASVASSVGAVLKPAGLDVSTGVITAAFTRDPTDSRWNDAPEMKEYKAWLAKYYPEGDVNDSLNVLAYASAQTLVQVLKQAGDDLTRENVMRQAANLKLTLPMLYPGVDIQTGPKDYFPVEKMQLMRFNGAQYEPLGQVLGQ